MVTVTLLDILDLTGFSQSENVKGTRVSGLLELEPIRSALERKIKTDYAKNKMNDLLRNISDSGFTSDVHYVFTQYIDRESQPTLITNPTLANRPTDTIRSLTKLITDLRDRTKEASTQDTTAAGATFVFNASKYVIELTYNELSALEAEELAILAAAEIQPDFIVPKSAIVATDANYGEKYARQPFPVYTGIDMQVLFMTPHVISNNITLKLLSYSMHSGLIPVSTLGRKKPKGFSEGDTTIAGTMIATLTVNDPLHDMQPLQYGVSNYAKSTSDVWRTYLLPDQFPLFDIVLFFSNEAGFTSSMVIFGVKITDVGSVMSMTDSEIEVTYTWTGLDIDLLRSVTGEGSGNVTNYDIMKNNEYLIRRKMAYDGNSTHRDHFEVGEIYGKLDNRADEIAYNNLRMKGLNLVDVYNFQKFGS